LKKYQSNNFIFCWKGPGRGSEHIEKESNVKCFDFFFFFVFLMDVMVGKITINLKEPHQNRKRRNTRTPEKSQKRHKYRKDA